MANCICAACKWRISTILFPSSVILSLLINSPYLIPTDQLDFTLFYKWQYSIVLQQAWALLKRNRNTESGKFLCSSDSFWDAVVITLLKVPFRCEPPGWPRGLLWQRTELCLLWAPSPSWGAAQPCSSGCCWWKCCLRSVLGHEPIFWIHMGTGWKDVGKNLSRHPCDNL